VSITIQGQEVPPEAIGMVAILAAIICLFWSARSNRKRRLMSDLPTSKTTGVFIGFNELKGTAEVDYPIRSYLAETPSVYYSYSIGEHWSKWVTEYYTDSKGKRRSRRVRKSGVTTVQSDNDMCDFFLRDNVGQILIHPDGADIEPKVVFSRTVGRGSPLYYGKGPRRSVMHSDHRRTFTEYAIPEHAMLYVLGQARERDDIVAAEIALSDHAPDFLISTRSEEEIIRGKSMSFWLTGITGFGFAGLGGHMLSQGMIGAVVGAVVLYGVLLFFSWFITVFNSIAGLKNRVEQAYSLIDVQLKRRHDLIPNLTRVINEQAQHEAIVQTSLAEIRARNGASEYRACKFEILALAEAYPDLKSSEHFMQLSQEIVDTEDRIALARNYYNEMVSFYNTRLETVPDGWISGMVGMRPAPFLEFEN